MRRSAHSHSSASTSQAKAHSTQNFRGGSGATLVSSVLHSIEPRNVYYTAKEMWKHYSVQLIIFVLVVSSFIALAAFAAENTGNVQMSALSTDGAVGGMPDRQERAFAMKSHSRGMHKEMAVPAMAPVMEDADFADEAVTEMAGSAPPGRGREGGIGKSMANSYKDIQAEDDGEDSSASNAGRMLIKNARMSMTVDDDNATVGSVQKACEKIVADVEGYVHSANAFIPQPDQQWQTQQLSMTLKVPVNKLEKVMAAIGSLAGVVVNNENVDAQDVTQEYTDVMSRIKTLEATHKQLLVLMEKSVDVKDVLQVQRELTRITEQLEVQKGRQKYLERSSAMSTIHISFNWKNKYTPPEPPKPAFWSPFKTAGNAIVALLRLFTNILDAFIWVAIFVIPVSFAVVVPLTILYRKYGMKLKTNGVDVNASTASPDIENS